MDDFLALEPLLVARLAERVQAALPNLAILTVSDLAGVAEEALPDLALVVIYRGYRPAAEKGNGAIQQIEQEWAVVTFVRAVRELESGADLRAAAGPVLWRVCEALLGWPRPSAQSEFSPLRLVSGLAPRFGEGVGYFPLTFTTHMHARGAP